jgi:hypothetical protein
LSRSASRVTLGGMQRGEIARRALGAWCLTGLLVAFYHEPWRAEAQSWLIARTASSLGDLFFRSASEGAGPLYYLWLWPWAKLFPAAFPSAPFWLSWVGTCLAAGWLLFSDLLPLKIALLAVFGYLLGYEYATFARLYGWGLFLLIAGMDLDRRGKSRPAALCLAASCLVQVSFVFGAFGWWIFRALEGKNHRHYGWVAGAAAFLCWYLWPALGVSGAKEWLAQTGALGRLGSTLGVGVAPSHWQLGFLGFVAAGAAFYPLSKKARIAFLLALVPFALLFLMRFQGVALGRHGGAPFALWLALLGMTASWEKIFARRAVQAVLGMSLLLGIVARVQDLVRPYSEGLAAARAIETVSREENKVPRLFAIDENFGFVVAARLNQTLWTVDSPMGCPYFAGKCPDTLRPQKDVWSRLEVAELCPKDIACFFVGESDKAEPFALTRGRWERIFLPGSSLVGEDVVVYRLSRK